MASNSESPTRSRSRHKQQRNENMEVETNTKEDALERSIEEIRSKMKEKRRKKVQADLSHSRSRHKNANLVLKATLRQNNRTLAKSLEVSRNEHRHAQNDLVELQRERHMLQSIVNRFQGQHDKQRSQIKGVHEVLRKVTCSLMDTVGLLGQAMDMCVIPRHTKDRSLGLIFRTSSLTSDDLSDSETKEEGGSASAKTSAPNLSSIPRRIPANKDILNQSTVKNNPEEEIEDLPDIDVPLCFMSDKKAPQGKERTRRDTRNISAENQKVSRRTSSLLNPATMAAVATEIEKSVENIRTVLEETGDDGEGSDKKQATVCIDDEETTQDIEMDEVESGEESPDRRVTKKRSGRLSLRKESVASEHGHGEVDEETGDASSMSKDDAGKRRSGRLSNKRRTYVYPDDDDEDESKEKGDCMELVPEDEEIIESSSDIRGSRERSRRLSRRRGTFVKEGDDLKTFGTEDDLMEIEILDDDDDEANVGSKVGNLNQQEDNVEEAEAELQQKHKSDAIEPDEGLPLSLHSQVRRHARKARRRKKTKTLRRSTKKKTEIMYVKVLLRV
ncbi:protein IWS1 homolog [Strongylocentrotus purpuratus]|uniref:Shugoshin C-terminal domain-containing protein n=1 Tax=Strongylocentrotus purpuratus TaxID=7668 RepID=A0A7M7T113_STRPU|nr:protein IWS1 homolog [Strongylocentrotus purpuratus]